MIKKKNKIRVLLTEDGSISKLELPTKLHTGSINMTDIEVLVPITVNRTSSSFVKIYGNTVNEKGEKVWNSKTYSVNFKTIDVVNKFEYAVYEDNLPDEFCAVSGDLNLTITYADLDEDGVAIDLLPSQTIHLYVNGAGFNQNGVQISNYDATSSRVNLLSELSILKLDVDKELPLGAIFSLDGFKTPFYEFYSDEGSITYDLPTQPATTESKVCSVLSIALVKDKETPEVIGYQTEFAYFDGGVCQRTNKYNISQGSMNNYVLLELGAWQLVNQEYINSIKVQADQNSEDIEKLYRITSTGQTFIGEYPSQTTLPTDSELNAFVQERVHRAPQSGDEVTFVLEVENGTDVIYLIRYSEATNDWTATAYPTIEEASNTDLGLIKGSTGNLTIDIEKGEIKAISAVNESNENEDIAVHLNRNSTNIATNASNISKNAENIQNEVERAKAAEEVNATAIETEKTRAEGAEQTLTDNLNAEISRAKAAEEENATAIEEEAARATTAEQGLGTSKLDKSNVAENYLQGITFALNGDTNVASASFKNPATGETETIELNVLTPASSTTPGVMTAEMVQSLNQALEDIESLKYVGRQIASFPTYADAELFDFSTIDDIKENDYFIIQVDESRTEPTEKDKTTKYVCIDETKPITLDGNFRFQTVITTVNIQVATESSLGGVLSVNTNGYIYVESTGAMKLVGYDNIITSISNLTQQLTNEVTRATAAEQVNAEAIAAEKTRAEGVEQTLSQSISTEQSRAEAAEQALETNKADKTELPTKLSELENDSNYATVGQLPTKTSQLTNDSNFATVGQIPTKTSQLQDDVGFAKIKFDTAENWETNDPILGIGVFGYDITNKVLKIGDGVTDWCGLKYFNFVYPPLENASWELINQLSISGEASTYWRVGDEKNITLTSGEEVTLVILGFNHDDLASGGKAGITFGMKELTENLMNINSQEKAGGWEASDMRNVHLVQFLNLMPNDLKNTIKEVNKKTLLHKEGGFTEQQITIDKLWLLSQVELCGSDVNSSINEGQQYEYYKDKESFKKLLSNGSGEASDYWYRTPGSGTVGVYWLYNIKGLASNSSANSSELKGVSFCFCI